MKDDWPFVGRQEELALIAQAMAEPGVGGLVLAGPAGVGKTRLALEVMSRVDPDRYVTQWVSATPATQPIPFGALAPLLAADLPAAGHRVNLLRLVAEALAAIAGDRRLALGVDDAQLLDELSAGLLNQMVRAASAFVLVIVRSGEPAPDTITALWRNRIVERLDLEHLLRPDAEQAVAEYLGGPVDGLTARRLWQDSAGNGLLLRELVTAGRRAGGFRSVEGMWRWQGPRVLGPRLVDLIEQRLGRLALAEQEVVELLAFADPIGPDLLGRLVSAAAVEAVEANGLCAVRRHGRRMLVHLTHPLYGEVLRSRTPVLRARRRQRQLAEAVEQVGARRADDALQVATWRLAAGGAVSPQLLLDAARRAWALLDLSLAERMATAALRAGAVLQASTVLWGIYTLQGRNHEVERLLAAVEPATTGDRERAGLASARAYNQFLGLDREDVGLATLDATLSSVTDPTQRERLDAVRAALLAHVRRFREVAELTAQLTDRRQPAGPARAHCNLATGLTQLFHGRPADAIASFDDAAGAAQGSTDTPWLPAVALLWRCQAQLLDGQLHLAAETAGEAYRRALTHGWDFAIATSCLSCSEAARATGRLRQSLQALREALGIARQDAPGGYLYLSIVLGGIAHTAAVLGDHITAERALVEADATRRRALAIYHPWLDLARPWLHAARGDNAAAIREALRHATALHETGAAAYEAVALNDAARLGAAGKVTDRLLQLAGNHPGPLVQAYAAHARALAGHDGPALEAVSMRLEALGALLLAAEAATEASAAHRRAGRADGARRASARAAVLAGRCDGASTPALRGLHVPELTPRQWEIAKLAVAGLTNDEIAEQLTVSIRTVHNHLHQAYAKLGVHNRTELATVIERQLPV